MTKRRNDKKTGQQKKTKGKKEKTESRYSDNMGLAPYCKAEQIPV